MAVQKVALVTGAGTGIGKAAALALAKDGYAVVLAGRRLALLEETQQLGKQFGDSLPVQADMTDPPWITTTLAPAWTRRCRSMTSWLNMRIQPDETAVPMVSGSLVP